MNNELICPNCHVALDERQLLAHTWSVETCPHCRAVVRRQEGIRWEDREATSREDVALIEAWLIAVTGDAKGCGPSAAVERRSSETTKGKYHWEVTAAAGAANPRPPWVCTVEYDPDTPRVCEVRLTSSQHDRVLLDNPAPLFDACADQGVQAHAREERRWVEWEGERREVRWGARQLLATGFLSAALFRSVVRRLDRAMQDARARAGVGPPESALAGA
jgi:hypothetical protein